MVRYYPHELYHHGILGMKWGVRRYQNPDGTRTELGKRRERTGDSKGRKAAKTAGKVALGVLGATAAKAAYDEAKGREPIDREEFRRFMTERDPHNNNKTAFESSRDDLSRTRSDIRRTHSGKAEAQRRKKYRSEASGLSDAELRERVNRLNLEKQYVDLSNGKATDGNWSYGDTVNYGMNQLNNYITYGLALSALFGAGKKIFKKVH